MQLALADFVRCVHIVNRKFSAKGSFWACIIVHGGHVSFEHDVLTGFKRGQGVVM